MLLEFAVFLHETSCWWLTVEKGVIKNGDENQALRREGQVQRKMLQSTTSGGFVDSMAAQVGRQELGSNMVS